MLCILACENMVVISIHDVGPFFFGEEGRLNIVIHFTTAIVFSSVTERSKIVGKAKLKWKKDNDENIYALNKTQNL